MNNKQRILLGTGLLACLAMLLFPPWTFVYDRPPSSSRSEFTGSRSRGHEHSERPAGYHFIAGQHRPSDEYALIALFGNDELELRNVSIKMDTQRLLIQVLIVGLVALFAYWTLAKPRQPDA